MLRNASIRNDRNLWSQPGGAVEFGETIEQAIKREAVEEIGVEVELLELLNVNDHMIDGAHWIAPAYLCRIISGELKNMEPEKCEEIRWFSLSALPENLNENTKNSTTVLKRRAT